MGKWRLSARKRHSGIMKMAWKRKRNGGTLPVDSPLTVKARIRAIHEHCQELEKQLA